MAVYPPNVRTIVDGQSVDAATTNGPIADLTNRTAWLRQQIDSLEAGTRLQLRSRTVDPGLPVGSVVYRNPQTNRFEGAVAGVDPSELSRAADSAFWQGILVSASAGSGDIVLGGSMSLSHAAWAAVMDGGAFETGDMFLSATNEGHLTTDAGTSGIYLGHMIDSGDGSGELLVRLGNPGSFTEHIHLERTLLGQPAGTVVDPSDPTDPMVFDTPDPDERGWLPANDTYFPGFVVGVQIPVGAVFGYNIQHPDEGALREIFPLVPPSNAQFSQSDALLGPDSMIANQFGIWWMDNSYARAPWPVDYQAEFPPSTADDIRLWTTRLIASASILDLVRTSLINDFAAGSSALFSVSSLLSADPDTLAVVGTDGNAIQGYRGQVMLTPNGVNAIRSTRGITLSGSSGNNTAGFRGVVTAQFNAELPAEHMFTYLDPANADPEQTKAPLATSLPPASGTLIAAYGHRLGAENEDYIDFLIVGGSDLLPALDYRPAIKVNACVDHATNVGIRDVDIDVYRLQFGQVVSSARLQHSTQLGFATGAPGRLQQVVLGPIANVFLRRNEQLLVRVRPDDSNPVPPDTLRIASVSYTLSPAS